MLNPNAHGGVQLQLGKSRWLHPLHGPALAACAWRTTEQACTERNGELLAYLAVVVGHHMCRVGVEAGHPVDGHVVARLLFHLPDHGVGDGLADLVASAWEGPEVVVRLVDEQDASVFVGDDRDD